MKSSIFDEICEDPPKQDYKLKLDSLWESYVNLYVFIKNKRIPIKKI